MNPEKMDKYVVKTSNGQISWKKTAENLLESLQKQIEFVSYERPSDFKCPECGNQMAESIDEIHCSCGYGSDFNRMCAQKYEYFE